MNVQFRTDIDTYHAKLDEYVSRIHNKNLLVEVTKCCGYSEILPVCKTCTIHELYTEIHQVFVGSKCILYIKSPDGVFSVVPDVNQPLYAYIIENRVSLLPVYPIPAKVVYRIFVDDGHVHSDANDLCVFTNA